MVETAAGGRTVNKESAAGTDFKKQHFILPEYGTLGPKHVGEVNLISV